MAQVETGRDKPETYGTWWNTNSLDENWYREIFDVRPRAHAFFMDWLGSRHREGETITRILEVGCGRALYADFLKAYDYNGTDISEKEIEFCRRRHGGPAERFFVADAIADDLRGPYDLVFSHAVIDHVYDVNLFIQKLFAATTGWLYISAYRDWHPQRLRHEYNWYPEGTCYNNHLSPVECRQALEDVGARDIQVFPVFVDNRTDNFPFETVIIARK
ncbi:MAG: class I SAM-dependent methyltransferase [Hyphomonadaceae bacterium]